MGIVPASDCLLWQACTGRCTRAHGTQGNLIRESDMSSDRRERFPRGARSLGGARMTRGRPGRKSAHDPAVRAEALKIAASRGADAAAKALKLKPGTVRSWVRREHLRALRDRPDPDSGLDRLRRVGRRMLVGLPDDAP